MSTLSTTNIKHPSSGSNNLVLDASGNVTQNGSATAAAFIPSSSTVPTNGIYLPAANTVGISTNSVGRVFIDSSGRLGVGTNSPSGTVHAYNAGGLTSVVIGGDAASSYSQVQLRNSSAKYNWSLSAQNNVDNGFEITPSTAAGGSTFSTPAVVVKSDGKVGIGTSSPATALDVNGIVSCGTPGGVAISIPNGAAIRNFGSVSNTLYFDVCNGGAAHGSFEFRSSNAATTRMLIDSSGRVGIGTTSPGAALDVRTASGNCYINAGRASKSTGQVAVQLSGGTGGTDWIIYQDINSDNLRFFGNSGDRMTLDTSGRLLVGTTSGSYQLQLSTDSAGKPSTNTWTIVSDERIKEEIELADLDLCYEAVKNIPLKRFKWKDEVYTEEQAYDRRKLGWIAQDVEAVFPKAVRQHEFKYNQVFEEVVIPAVPAELDDDGNIITEEQPERIERGELISEEVIEDCRDLNSDQLYAAMYGAIQKLIAKVETLEAEVAALKG